MLIEMLGAPSAKKTALMDYLETNSSDRAFLTPFDLEQFQPAPGTQQTRSAVNDPQMRGLSQWLLAKLVQTNLEPARIIEAAQHFGEAEDRRQRALGIVDAPPIVHDNLLLQQALHILSHHPNPTKTAKTFFSRAPLPNAAIVVDPSEGTSEVTFTTSNLCGFFKTPKFSGQKNQTDKNSSLIAGVAKKVFTDRGIPTLWLNSKQPTETNGKRILKWLDTIEQTTPTKPNEGKHIFADLIEVSTHFQTQGRSYARKNPNIAYASFSTRHLTVPPWQAQRNNNERLQQMQLSSQDVLHRTVLDLGSYTGAMLFEMARLGVTSGLGIEIDAKKVGVAQRIAALSALDHLQFQQGNIDELDCQKLGKFDIVMCLAIEAHVTDRDHLFQLLGNVTGHTCYFETNGRTCENTVREQLLATGFRYVDNLGVSKDDADPRNHKRLLLRAVK